MMFRANDDDTTRDRPLARRWLPVTPNALESIHLPAPRSSAYASAREAILLDAAMAVRWHPERWISYSRRPAFYANASRYRDPALSFANVPRAVDELHKFGLIEHQKAVPGCRDRQSRFRASELLAKSLLPTSMAYDPGEVIRLRNADRKLVDYRDIMGPHD